VNATRAAQRVVVTPDGDGVMSHAGSLLIAELADRLDFTKAASVAMQVGRSGSVGTILEQVTVTTEVEAVPLTTGSISTTKPTRSSSRRPERPSSEWFLCWS
jgi:hypothetical protein